MERKDIEEYFNIALATSVVVFGFDLDDLHILLKYNTEAPFKGAYILPSKYIKPETSIDLTVKKILNSIEVEDAYIEQLNASGKVFRNPLGRVVNIGHYGLIRFDPKETAKFEKMGLKWFRYDEIPDLAYDHNQIIDFAKERLKRRVKRRPVGFNLLPEEFTIGQLQQLYEKALNKSFDKRNFRKKIFNSELLVDLDKSVETSSGKESKLYKFDEDKYAKMSSRGYDFLF
ncbi:MAG: NUDIX hydrolase [Ichthyobacteriaceae bacterium]|nr:NUDIX hydrolase [Ichthyobacteriaceae bacterium]